MGIRILFGTRLADLEIGRCLFDLGHSLACDLHSSDSVKLQVGASVCGLLM
jgi:hypothetical protein